MMKENLCFPKNVTFKRVYDWLPYSHWRIKQILRDDYNCHLRYIHPGYKGDRYPGYVEKYDLIDNATGEVIASYVTLDRFRRIFAMEEYPLQRGEKRNPGAEEFLRIVQSKQKLHLKNNK